MLVIFLNVSGNLCELNGASVMETLGSMFDGRGVTISVRKRAF